MTRRPLAAWIRFRLAWAQLRSAPARLASTIVAIALGVALAASIMLVGRAVSARFRESVEAVTGAADLHVFAAGGAAFDETVTSQVAAVPGVAAVAPVLVRSTFVDDERGDLLTLYGVDMLNEAAARLYRTRREDGVDMDDPLVFLSQPDSLMVTPAFLAERHLARGDRVSLVTPTGVQTFTIRGVLQPEGLAKALGAGLLVMDVYSAQPLFATDGRITQLDVVVAAEHEVARVARDITASLPPGLRVEAAGKRRDAVQQLMAGYQHMLDSFSVVGLLVAALVTFNRLSTVFRARVWEIGVARTLGASRRQVVAELLKESTLMAGVGILLGLPLGCFLAGRVMPIGTDIAALTMNLPSQRFAVPIRPLPLCLAALLGMATTLVAAILPALRVADVPIATVLRSRGLLELPGPARFAAGRVRLSLLVVFLLGLALYRLDQTGVVAGTTGLLGLVVVCTFIGPALAAVSGPVGECLARIVGPIGRFSVSDLLRVPERTIMTVTTLTVGLALAVWFGTFGNGFETSVMRTLAASRQADLIVSSAMSEGNDRAPIDEGILAELARLPDVALVSGERGALMPTYGVSSFDPAQFENPRLATWDLGPSPLPDALARVARGEAILASPAFQKNFHVAIGDRVTLETPVGPWTTVVAGTNQTSFYSPAGDVVVSRTVFRERWHDHQIVRAHVLLAPGASTTAAREAIARAVGRRYQVGVYSAQEIAEAFGALVRRGMVFTHVLLAITLLVVVLGTADTLAASVLDRTREIGTMRAIGMPKVRVAAMLAVQSVTMGLVSVLGGWVAGLLLTRLYLFVFSAATGGGWIRDVPVHYPILVDVLVLSVLTCAVAAVIPALRAARLTAAEALRYE